MMARMQLKENHDTKKHAKNLAWKLESIHIQDERGRNSLGHKVKLLKTLGKSFQILTSNFTSPRDLHKSKRHP